MRSFSESPSSSGSESLSRFYPWGGVFQGRFAMWSGLYSQRPGSRWPVDWEISWGVVPMARDQSSAALAVAEGLFISASSEHPAEAWSWIQFVSQQMPPYQIPARRSLVESAEFERRVGNNVAATARAALADAVFISPDLLLFGAGLDALGR